MRLPELPNIIARYAVQNVGMAGLNYSDNFKDGELAESKNLSTRAFPFLTQRKGRAYVTDKKDTTSIFAWDGKLVVAAGTELSYGGDRVGNIEPGKKQFAVVNTKLCIFPDKKYLNVESKEFGDLEAKYTTLPGTTTFTEDGLTISAQPKWEGEDLSYFDFTTEEKKYIRTYTGLTWDDEKNVWNKEGESEKLLTDLAPGDLLIPAVGDYGQISLVEKYENGTYEKEENTVGKYIKVTETDSYTEDYAKWEAYSCNEIRTPYYQESQWKTGEPVKLTGNVTQMVIDRTKLRKGYANYSFDEATGKFTLDTEKTAEAGDFVYRASKDPDTTLGTENLNTIWKVYFTDSTTFDTNYKQAVGPLYNVTYEKGDELFGIVRAEPGSLPENGRYEDDGLWYVAIDGTGQFINGRVNYEIYDDTIKNKGLKSEFAAGDRVQISGCTGITANNTDTSIHLVVKEVNEYSITFTTNTLRAGTEEGSVTIKRPIPYLDYICQSENRLWGVSNKDNTIYASALGDPTSFYDYDGLSTDSYAVAVATEDDFTGIVAYSSGVLCWKENVLHKVIGSYPADYAIYTYTINGLQKGSEGSMQVINEVLYYKGKQGVYSFSGGTPQLISYNLGGKMFGNANAGADESRYYISMQDVESGQWGFYVYDLIHGLWLREDDTKADSFATVSGVLHFLANNTVYRTNANSGEEFTWEAQFVPMYETLQGRKRYSKVAFRFEVPEGSYVIVYVKMDNGEWKEAGKIVGKGDYIVPIRIVPNRCDKFEIKLTGKGPSTILSMRREFSVGGDNF